MLLAAALLVPLALGEAQEEAPSGESGAPGIFPVSLLLEAAETAALWQPDWPLPPDAFRPQNREAPFLGAEVSISAPDGSGEAPAVYRFVRDGEGRVRECPFLLEGEPVQAEFSYNSEFLAAAITLRHLAEGEDPEGASLELEVLRWEASRPSLIRVLAGGTYSFVFIQRKAAGILETWHDTEGRLLGAYDFTLAPQAGGERIVSSRLRGSGGGEGERRYYDSRGLVTGISGPHGNFAVLYYLDDLPRYWDYRPAPPEQEAPSDGEAPSEGEAPPAPAAWSLDWDEKTFLLMGLSSSPPFAAEEEAPGEAAAALPVDCRYEYTLDERGNWIERREIRMIRTLDLLVPSRGVTIRRNLEYGEEE
jgi:hypothetical protein